MKRPTISMPISQDAQTKNEPTTLSMLRLNENLDVDVCRHVFYQIHEPTMIECLSAKHIRETVGKQSSEP